MNPNDWLFNYDMFCGINNWCMPTFPCTNPFGSSMDMNFNFNPFEMSFQLEIPQMPDFSQFGQISNFSTFSASQYITQPNFWHDQFADTNSFMNFVPPTTVNPADANIAVSTTKTAEPVVLPYKVSENNVQLEGYNKNKGELLAKIAYENRNTTPTIKDGEKTYFLNQCGKFVRQDLQKAGLFNGMIGRGFEYLNILRHNNNFKEISFSDSEYKRMPPGCIYVYDKGVSGCSKENGHVQIALGNNTAVSDGIDEEIKKPSAIFMPV